MDKGLVQKLLSAGLLREEWPEYRLVVPAEEPVSRQVRQLRVAWEEAFGKGKISEKPPSITLACFEAREEMEPMIIHWIRNICERQLVFPVTLNNFSAIPPQVVYIRVQEEEPFRKLAEPLKTLETFLLVDPARKARIFEKPFIKLGKLPEQGEARDWFQYSHQLFHAAFMARKMLLLRKENTSWRTVSVFPFKEN